MKVETQHLTLAKGELKLTVSGYTLADVRALSDEHLMSLADMAIDGWKYRDACRKPKEADDYPMQGKTLKLAEIAADGLREKGRRSAGPSEKDIKDGIDLANRCRVANPLADLPEIAGEAPEATLARQKAAKALVASARKAWCMERFEARKELQPWLSFEWDYSLPLEENCARLQRAVRQPRPQPKVKKLGAL